MPGGHYLTLNRLTSAHCEVALRALRAGLKLTAVSLPWDSIGPPIFHKVQLGTPYLIPRGATEEAKQRAIASTTSSLPWRWCLIRQHRIPHLPHKHAMEILRRLIPSKREKLCNPCVRLWHRAPAA